MADQTSNPAATPTKDSPFPASSTSLLPFKQQLITALGIPTSLTGTGDVSLQVAYQKYKAFLVAFDTYEEMVKEKTWTLERTTKANIIELFVSKSFFHSHYKRWFSKVADYEEMALWLSEKEDRMCDINLWGVKKEAYTFTDLATWLQNGGTLEVESDGDYRDKGSKGKKGKGLKKENTKVQEKRKEKGKERKLEKTKEKEKGKVKGKEKRKERGSEKESHKKRKNSKSSK